MWIYYLPIALFLVVAINLYFRIATRFGVTDHPNERSSHSAVTIRGGGIIFLFAYLAYLLFASSTQPFFSIGVILISVVSFLDDVRPLPNRLRAVVHCICAGLLLHQLGWAGEPLPWVVLPAVLLFAVGTINAYNFMDGINGILGIYSIVVLLAICLANHFVSAIDPGMLSVMLIALGIFGFYNFRVEARCFAGDVGSIGIAYIVLYCLLRLSVTTGDFSYLFFLLVYGLDTGYTIVRRLWLRENIFAAHRTHLYQFLANELRVPHVSVSLWYGGTQLGICLLLIANMQFWRFDPVWFCLGLAIVFSAAYLIAKHSALAQIATTTKR